MVRPHPCRAVAGRVGRGSLAAIGVVLVSAALAAGSTASAQALPGSAQTHMARTSRLHVAPLHQVQEAAGRLSVQPGPALTARDDGTGVRVSIDTVHPAALTRGEHVKLKGVVRNTSTRAWKDAQVYLDVGYDPATSRAELDAFGQTTEGFGTRVVEFGLFDEIGRLKPDSTKPYSLSVPFGKLPISQAPGVYHVGVTVIAGDRDGDRPPVARADTLLPLLPQSDDANQAQPTGVVTLVPLAAPIRRMPGGSFLDDDLAHRVAYGGQLQNLLDFVAAAPADSLEVVLDPALRQALSDMADGYTVRSLAEIDSDEPGRPGEGDAAATRWLNELDDAVRRQDLLFMPWGSPDVSALGSHNMPGVVEAAVRASQRYASDQRITTTVASWPYAGAATRRGLAVAARSEAPLRVISQRSLVNLRGRPDASYPPTQVLVPTAVGQTTALVTRTDVAGDVITVGTTEQRLLQDIVAEATVRSLDDQPRATSVIAVPFGWDPGVETDDDRAAMLTSAYEFPTVAPTTASSASQHAADPYPGRIRMPGNVRPLSADVLASVLELRNAGRTLTDLLTDQEAAAPRFDETLAAAGSSLWRGDPDTRVAVNDRASRSARQKTGQVTVTGPTFVALSSASGRFPLTVTNGLTVPVTVQVVVRAENPAVSIDPIDKLALDPGQRRDIEAIARSKGSGLTGVRVRLTTSTHRPIGSAWDFDIRSTQIGVAIWVVMGVGAAILFGAAARRIVRRIRSGRLQTREDPSP